MFADTVEACGKLLAKSRLAGKRHGLAVKSPENNPSRFIGSLDLQPHPFGLSGLVIPDFEFDVITSLV
jgi:hypothetical protein